MKQVLTNNNEELAAAAFTKQSNVFDRIYSDNIIINYKRERVRTHIKRFLSPESRILELNSGTGEDATWFARQGHWVHAIDISEGMKEVFLRKISEQGLENRISHETISFTQLNLLKNKGPYDHIFSNFAGLNCTAELGKVLDSFEALLKPGGVVTLVIMPKFCLWEILMVFKGKFKTAFRRFAGKKGAIAHIEGIHFHCWYYNPSFIIKHLKKEYSVLNIEGLCSLVPPSFIENFAEKYPRMFNRLKRKEEKWKNQWPWRSFGDYYIISLRKRMT